MNIIRLFLELFGIYILYKFVFEFIIPVFNTTKQMKQKMHEMHDKMQQQQASYNRPSATQASPKTGPKAPNEDYIEYEEVK